MLARPAVTCVVVTFNRLELLKNCLNALKDQTEPPGSVLIINNASTDGTLAWLSSWLPENMRNATVVTLKENTGGAGGFAEGLRVACANGADWVWMMDDDAIPHPDALEKLLRRDLDQAIIYGSVARNGDLLSWPMTKRGGNHRDTIYKCQDLPQELNVQFIPFLGILISALTVEKIGLPDGRFFLAADDVDYCLRAASHGIKVVLVGDSFIDHPLSQRYRLWIPGRPFYSLRLAPWKRYYDVRNRLFVARRHYGLALYYSTIPGSFLRLLATLFHEADRGKQLLAFVGGMVDGLLGRSGRRHEKWHI